MRKLAFVALLLMFSLATYAQFGLPMGGSLPIGGGAIVFSKLKIVKGNTAVLAGKKIQVVLIADSMEVADYGTEEKFVNAMIAYYDQKGTGQGKRWSDSWYLNRNEKFKELFISKFNQLGKKTHTSVQPDSSNASYKLIIKTTFLSIGENAGVSKDPARIRAICDFQDMSGRSFALVTAENVPGQTAGTGDYDISTRVAQCYQKLGKDLFNTISNTFPESEE